MSAYPDQPDPYGRGRDMPTRPLSRSTRMNAARLWAAGLATAVVAALVALVGVLIVRALLRIDLFAPHAAGAFGSSATTALCVGAAVAALAATGLAHLLIVSTPRPLSYFSWIVGLLTTAAVVVPFTWSASLPIALAQAVIHLVIGLAIGSLVSGAASSAMRTAAMSERPFNVE